MESEALIEKVQQDAPKQPKCPRCYALLEFLCNVVRTPVGHLVSVTWCGRCGHTLNVQFIGMDQPPEGPRIVRPS